MSTVVTALGSTATLRVSTPEGVTFALPLAGPFSRALATFIDFLAVMVINRVLSFALIFSSMISFDLTTGLQILLQFVLSICYSTLCELLFRGQTIGKKVVGLRVMDERGLTLRPSQVMIRNLVRIADQLPILYGVGGICCLLNKRCQRLGDLAAGTIVVRTTKTTAPDVDAILGGKYNSFRAYPHLEARLRQKISAELAQVALQALVRREELEPTATVQLFSTLAEHLRSIVKFPEEVTLGLSDEQYVCNVVDSLYRRAK
jgi:uncharacterized RDD family membrane protein YckC